MTIERTRVFRSKNTHKVKLCQVFFGFQLNSRLLRVIQTLGLDKVMRGSNIVTRLSRVDKQLVIELRSGFFNGRVYNEKTAHRRASRCLHEIGLQLHDHRNKVSRMMLSDWVLRSEWLEDVIGLEDRKLVSAVQKALRVNQVRIDDLIKYSINTSYKIDSQDNKHDK